MIRADLANRLQPAADLSLRPSAPLQEITDKLSGLIAGQRVLAEIQSLLPNGSYRALINQRSMTLALPFAAKAGDAIELEVSESDGKLTLAVLADAAARTGKGDTEAAATSLSQTGRLISSLLGGARERGSGPAALPLNDNQPIAAKPPDNAQDLLPLLKQAIAASGMFYESHQAEWVEGRYNKAQLLQEPQGKLTPLVMAAQTAPPGTREIGSSTPSALVEGATVQNRATETASMQPSQSSPAVAPQAQTLVQQQLEAFATQNFSWQGQIWPGQGMNWEIEDAGERRQSGGEESQKWQTRLRLTLPTLGEVDARLHIQGRQIALSVVAGNSETRDLLRSDANSLRSQFEQAGLDLGSLGIAAPPDAPAQLQQDR